MKIADAVAALGYADDPDLGHLLLAWPTGSGWSHCRPGAMAGHLATDDFPHLYLASGYFRFGTDRTAANLGGVFTLPFDADLKDFLGLPKEIVYALPQEEIDEGVEAQLDAVTAAFRDIGIQWERIDYTGHGLCIHVGVIPGDRGEVERLRAAHKRLVATLNGRAGFPLFDPACSDAGTRLFRLVPGLNGKSNPPRRTRVLEHSGLHETIERLAGFNWVEPVPPAPRIRFRKTLAMADHDALVAALRPHWRDGSRHLPALGIVGMLAKAGITDADAEVLLHDLGDDPDPRDRDKVVRTTYDHVAAGRPVAGYTALRNVLPPEALAAIDAVLAPYRAATVPRVEFPADPVPPPEPDDGLAPPPKTVAYGLFREYADFMEPYSEAPWQYHVACALTVAGQLVGRRARIEWFTAPLYPTNNALLVGRSGQSRKDWSIDRALELVTRSSAARVVAPPFHTFTDIASAEGLFDVLNAHPEALYRLSEFTDLVGKANRPGTANIFDALIRLWDQPRRLESNRRGNSEAVEDPCLSILAATQPGRLANAMASEAIQSGFANRWLIVPGRRSKELPVAPPLDRDGFMAIAWELRDVLRQYEGVELVKGTAAVGFFKEWYHAAQAEELGEEESDMRQRHDAMAWKQGTLNAMQDGSGTVEPRHVEPAFAFIDWMWANLRILMRTWGGNVESRIERRIRQTLAREGPMHRAALRDRVRGPDWGVTEYKRTFEFMADEGSLALDALGTVALRRPGGGLPGWA